MDVERLIDRHKDAVYRQMVRVCGNYDDAEDALADAMLAAVRASEQLREAANFRAWLARIGTRACVRSRVRQRLANFTSLTSLQEAGIDLQDDNLSPADEAVQQATHACIDRAVGTLPGPIREVYVQREILGETAEDVSKELGISIPALKSRLHRARKTVRQFLDEDFGCGGLVDASIPEELLAID